MSVDESYMQTIFIIITVWIVRTSDNSAFFTRVIYIAISNKVDIFYLVSNSCVETNVESSGIVNTSVSHNLIIE